MTTMRDVADVAGVSATTVSHVLNATRRVDPATREAVLAAIEQTGYSANSAARSLRLGRTSTIGVAMSAISNPYFGDQLSAIEHEAALDGYSVLLSDTHDDPLREEAAIDKLTSYGIDAAILAPSANADATIRKLRRRRIPVVLIDRVPSSTDTGIDAIGVINTAPIERLTLHLAQTGHERIAMISDISGLATTEERIQGYRTALAKAALPDDALLLRRTEANSVSVERALSELLELPDPPTALVLGNNRVTISAMRELHRRGVRVPDDIAVVCFDDFEWADTFHPTLTAISQPISDIARGAVELLLRRLDDPAAPTTLRRLEPTIMHRESCGCPEGTPL